MTDPQPTSQRPKPNRESSTVRTSPNGFPRAARLLAATEFKRVFERRPVQRGRFFTLHFREQAGSTPVTDPGVEQSGVARIGIVVPKKLLKTAVHRNLVKRIVRESFRGRSGSLAKLDIVVRLSAKPLGAAGSIDRTALALDVAALLDRLPKVVTVD